MRRNHPEEKLMESVFEWLQWQYPSIARHAIHIPNEGKRSIIAGFHLKRSGLKKGVSDFYLAYPGINKRGLWIEFKIGKNKPTPAQIEWLEGQLAVGDECAVCRTLEEAIKVIKKYLEGSSYGRF